jgi:hypothetical protein
MHAVGYRFGAWSPRLKAVAVVDAGRTVPIVRAVDGRSQPGQSINSENTGHVFFRSKTIKNIFLS